MSGKLCSLVWGVDNDTNDDGDDDDSSDNDDVWGVDNDTNDDGDDDDSSDNDDVWGVDNDTNDDGDDDDSSDDDDVIMMMMIIIVVVVVVTIITLKGTFLHPLTVQLTRSRGQGAVVCRSRAAHRALIRCNTSCAMWCQATPRPSICEELKSHLLIVSFHWLKPLADGREG